MRPRLLPVAAALLLLVVLAAWWADSRAPRAVELTPTLTGEPEYCLTCHSELKQISPSHPVASFGCVICHGGERRALDADLAHGSMRGGANPSDLAVAAQSCGGASCHTGSEADGRDHVQRVLTSVQSTYGGAIAGIRYTFGAQPDPIAVYGVHAVGDEHIVSDTGLPALQAFDPGSEETPMVQAFGENCLTCHLNAMPREGPAFARLTGCAACHSPLDPATVSDPQPEQHTLTTAISYAQCNTCHNRGNYDLRTMEFVERADQPADRLHGYYQPIAQFTQCEYTLDCIDCHTRVEAMGDGDIHSSADEIQYVQCRTCHGTADELPRTQILADPNDIAFRLAALNPVVDLQLGDTILVTDPPPGSGHAGEPLWNTRVLPDGTYEMIGKVTNQRFVFRPVMGSGCTQDSADQSSAACHECHAVERNP